MKTLIIIDDAINLKYIKHRNIKIYHVCMKKVVPYTKEVFGYTHSTRIIQIIEKYCDQELNIINIALSMDMNNQIDIHDLKTALDFCIHIKVDIINLSIGTKKISDIQYIRSAIQRLYEKGTIIVSAISNDFYMTLPASLPQVIGVMHDYENFLKPAEMKEIEENMLGVQYIANSTQLLSSENYIASNSFSVPLVITELLKNKNLSIENKKNNSINKREKILNIKKPSEKRPKVIIYGIKEPQELMNRLVIDNEIEAIGLRIMDNKVSIISLFEISKVQGEISDIINVAEKYILADLILIFKECRNNMDNLNEDLNIEFLEKQIVLRGKNKMIKSETCTIKYLASMIISYFEEVV